MREGNVQRTIWLALGRVAVLFRINTGIGWVSGAGEVRRLSDGSVLVPAARPVPLGLGMPDGKPVVGASDLQGWTSVTVTPEMVGRKVAIYTAIECKRTTGGRKSDDQRHFVDRVRAAGGISGFASSDTEARAIVAAYQPPHT